MRLWKMMENHKNEVLSYKTGETSLVERRDEYAYMLDHDKTTERQI